MLQALTELMKACRGKSIMLMVEPYNGHEIMVTATAVLAEVDEQLAPEAARLRGILCAPVVVSGSVAEIEEGLIPHIMSVASNRNNVGIGFDKSLATEAENVSNAAKKVADSRPTKASAKPSAKVVDDVSDDDEETDGDERDDEADEKASSTADNGGDFTNPESL